MTSDIYRRLFEDVTEGLALVDESGEIFEVNTAFADIFGFDKSELSGMVVHELVPDRVREEHVKYHDNFSKKPERRPMGVGRDLFGKRKDGTLVPIEISLSPVTLDERRITAVLVTDISDRKRDQEKIKKLNRQLEKTVSERTSDLKASQQLYSLISQNFPNGTINVVDKNLKYIFVEGLELKLMGISGSKMIGTSYIDRIPNTVRQLVKERLEQVFNGSSEKFDIELNNATYEMTAVPLEMDGEHVDQILVVERNVTEERRAREEIERALKKERDLNELQSRFVSMASHEFRTPLTTIKSSATLIGKYDKSDQQEKRIKHIDRIQSGVTHLIGILNDILSLSRLEEGKIELKAETIGLKSFIQELVADMELYHEKNVNLIYTITEKDEFVTDPNILRNILANLISNAVKYSFNDGTVEIFVHNDGAMLTLSVIDYGIGIPKEEQNKLFERFFRAHNVTNIEGTGLGLNIVKRFLDVLEGEISFTSVPNKRTEFKIVIPNGKG